MVWKPTPVFGETPDAGFALIVTIVLLALLVLTIYCLSALVRIGTEISASDIYQVQARQHALLGLSQAIGGLELYASEDDVLTGMAGITGIPEGAGQPARHWCGVWDRNGQFVRWLASGESEPVVPPLAGRGFDRTGRCRLARSRRRRSRTRSGPDDTGRGQRA
ncbi:MAG: hypothetical protein WDM96_12245 [Lacunisphaera sp.]